MLEKILDLKIGSEIGLIENTILDGEEVEVLNYKEWKNSFVDNVILDIFNDKSDIIIEQEYIILTKNITSLSIDKVKELCDKIIERKYVKDIQAFSSN